MKRVYHFVMFLCYMLVAMAGGMELSTGDVFTDQVNSILVAVVMLVAGFIGGIRHLYMCFEIPDIDQDRISRQNNW